MKKGGTRHETIKVKTAKRRKISSTLWLQRQLNDPFVISAKKDGYRSRAAYKLLGIDEKYKFLKPDKIILDLGAVPGSWSQIAVKKTGKKGKVVAMDLQVMDSIAGVEFVHGDFMDLEVQKKLADLLPNKADIILSDMAPNSTGHAATDHMRIMGLADEALEFVKENLNKNGIFLIKLLKGGQENKYADTLKEYFKKVRYAKPKASREDSREIFILAEGFR